MDRITEIINCLAEAGISCHGGFFPGNVPLVDNVHAVVHRKRIREGREVFSVTVSAPPLNRSVNCEETAMQVFTLLQGLDGICTLEECGYNMKMDRYMQEVTVYWKDPEPLPKVIVVKIGNAVQRNVTYCRSRQVYQEDKENPGHYIPEEWEVELRQEDVDPPAVNGTTFTLTVAVDGKAEIFTGCRWVDVSLERTEKGIELVRKCRAPGRTTE